MVQKLKCYIVLMTELIPFLILVSLSQPLNTVRQVCCKLCLDRYTWVVSFLVSNILVCLAKLGMDFIAKTGLMMVLRMRVFHFMFDPSNQLHLFTDCSHVPFAPGFQSTRYRDKVD